MASGGGVSAWLSRKCYNSFLVVNLWLGVLMYFFPEIFAYFSWYLMSYSILFLIVLLHEFNENIMFQLRVLLFSIVGYFIAATKAINPDLLFSPIAVDSQGYLIGVKIYALTLIGQVGVALGLSWGFSVGVRNVNKLVGISAVVTGVNDSRNVVYVVSFITVLIIGYLSARSYGPAIWNGAYGVGEGEGQLLGNLQSMGVIFLAVNWLSAQGSRSGILKVMSCFLAVYLLVFGILIRGGRLEFISGIMTLFVGMAAARGSIARVSACGYGGMILFVVFLEWIGHIRSNFNDVDRESLWAGYQRLYDNGILFAGTISGISTTISNVVHMVDNSVVGYFCGMSYAEYLPRTLPDFLYPGRPSDLATIFEFYGYESMGGFFELAEAYLNFGIVGAFVVPCFISYLMAYVFGRSLTGCILSYFLLIGFLSVFFRGAWYQTFAYYKAEVTAVVILMFIYMIIFARKKFWFIRYG